MFISKSELGTKSNLVVGGTETIDRSVSGIGTVIYEHRTVRRVFVTLTATIGWLALGLLLYIAIDHSLARGRTVPHILTFYFSLFTVLTNILVAFVLTSSLFVSDPKNFFLRPNMQSAVVVFIVFVGFIDFIFLDGLGKAHGLKLIAESLLHVVIPILYIIYWIVFVPKGTLLWINPFSSWLVYPLAYFSYILLRGVLTDKYPYRFINARIFGYKYVLLHATELLFVFVVLGLLVVAIDQWVGARKVTP